MSLEARSRLRVRSYELDSYGHVNNATYLNYLEFGRVEALIQTGKSFLDYLKENVFIVIVQANVSFLRPAFLHDELEIRTKLIRVGRTSVVLGQRIWNLTRNEETLSAEITAVFLDEHQKPRPVPETFLQQLGWHSESERNTAL